MPPPPDLYTEAFCFQCDDFKRWVSVEVIKLNEVRRGGWPDGIYVFTGRELMIFSQKAE